MKLTLTIEDATAADVARVAAALDADIATTEAPAKSQPVEEDEPAPKKEKAAPKKAKPKKEEPVEEQEAEENAPSLDDVKAVAVKLAKADRDKLAEILKDHKAENLSGLKESKYAAFIADVEEALE